MILFQISLHLRRSWGGPNRYCRKSTRDDGRTSVLGADSPTTADGIMCYRIPTEQIPIGHTVISNYTPAPRPRSVLVSIYFGEPQPDALLGVRERNHPRREFQGRC
ncbi:hypothetical protein B5X24_HaOG202086 [Helicoverpa armigera]|uniref:Uncharacterized protein n=1 Tax=Helicoverpa armigera TaxID=29058 RepID=A0A2W1C082_HELAM|nr:hypothetical protein B5X24_HaOG202086 [Helicoverpa armigera]